MRCTAANHRHNAGGAYRAGSNHTNFNRTSPEYRKFWWSLSIPHRRHKRRYNQHRLTWHVGSGEPDTTGAIQVPASTEQRRSDWGGQGPEGPAMRAGT